MRTQSQEVNALFPSLPFHAVALVLLAAVCHASWNAVVKIGGDRLVVIAVVNLVGAMVALLALPFVPFPAPDAWPWLTASVAVHLLAGGARSGDAARCALSVVAG